MAFLCGSQFFFFDCRKCGLYAETVKILAFLRLMVNFFQLRLTKILEINLQYF